MFICALFTFLVLIFLNEAPSVSSVESVNVECKIFCISDQHPGIEHRKLTKHHVHHEEFKKLVKPERHHVKHLHKSQTRQPSEQCILICPVNQPPIIPVSGLPGINSDIGLGTPSPILIQTNESTILPAVDIDIHNTPTLARGNQAIAFGTKTTPRISNTTETIY
ncbi:uncharacterized protein LOC109597920 [Aethina tumida]|uniref:uncharacterized protein LOC109597920 n=1 Tax=Aethina tumida TaxID=116153 RepID=UPI0021489AFD|nr:uncharacterized protein LOC109597920 [Aethina tumida]